MYIEYGIFAGPSSSRPAPLPSGTRSRRRGRPARRHSRRRTSRSKKTLHSLNGGGQPRVDLPEGGAAETFALPMPVSRVHSGGTGSRGRTRVSNRTRPEASTTATSMTSSASPKPVVSVSMKTVPGSASHRRARPAAAGSRRGLRAMGQNHRAATSPSRRRYTQPHGARTESSPSVRPGPLPHAGDRVNAVSHARPRIAAYR